METNELPKTVSNTLYIVKSEYGGPMITVCDMSEYGYVTLGTHEITLDVPQISQTDLVLKQVDVLKTEKQRLQAETQVKLNALDEKIQKLLAITYQPQAAQ